MPSHTAEMHMRGQHPTCLLVQYAIVHSVASTSFFAIFPSIVKGQ